jgi:hypothetical protein
MSSEEEIFLVEKLLGKKTVEVPLKKNKKKKVAKVLYCVRWQGYSKAYDTWEPEEGLPAICIREFEEQATLQELDSLVSGFDSSEKCEEATEEEEVAARQRPPSRKHHQRQQAAVATKKRKASDAGKEGAAGDCSNVGCASFQGTAVDVSYDGSWWPGRITRLLCSGRRIIATDVTFAVDKSQLRVPACDFKKLLRPKQAARVGAKGDGHGVAAAASATASAVSNNNKVRVAALQQASPRSCQRGSKVCVQFEGLVWYDGVVTAREAAGGGGGGVASRGGRGGDGSKVECTILYSDETVEEGIQIPDPDVFTVDESDKLVPVDISAAMTRYELVDLREGSAAAAAAAAAAAEAEAAAEAAAAEAVEAAEPAPKKAGARDTPRLERGRRSRPSSTSSDETQKGAPSGKEESAARGASLRRIAASDESDDSVETTMAVEATATVRSIWDNFLNESERHGSPSRKQGWHGGLGSWQPERQGFSQYGYSASGNDLWCGWPAPDDIRSKRARFQSSW